MPALGGDVAIESNRSADAGDQQIEGAVAVDVAACQAAGDVEPAAKCRVAFRNALEPPPPIILEQLILLAVPAPERTERPVVDLDPGRDTPVDHRQVESAVMVEVGE